MLVVVRLRILWGCQGIVDKYINYNGNYSQLKLEVLFLRILCLNTPPFLKEGISYQSNCLH